MKKILSLVLALSLVLGTMIVPAFAASAEYTFLMKDANLPSADCFAMDGDWVAVRTRAGTGAANSGDGIKNTIDITKSSTEALTTTVHFKTGSKPTEAKLSFLIRINLRTAPGGSGEWFHPFRIWSDSTLDKPKLEFASNKDSTTFVPATLDTTTGSLEIEYDTEYVLVTTITPNESGNAYFIAELYSVKDGAKDTLIGKGEVNNLIFDSSYAAQFGGLTVCDAISVMSINLRGAIQIEEPVAYVKSVNLKCGEYVKEEPEEEHVEGKVKFDSAVYSEKDTVFESEMTMAVTDMQRYGTVANEEFYATSVTDGKWNRYTWNAVTESTFVQEDSMIKVRPHNNAHATSTGNEYASYERRNNNMLVHSFTPITDGSEFAVRMTVQPYKPSAWPNKAFSMQFRLANATANADSSDSSKTFTIFTWAGSSETMLVGAVAAVNTTDLYGNSIRNNENFLGRTSYGYDVNLQNQDIDVEARFIPDGDNYNVYVTCTDASGNVLLENETPAVVPKADVATYSRFQLNTAFEQHMAFSGAEMSTRYIGFKNVEIAKGDFSSELSAGSNTFYIPYKKTGGDYFNATVVAAVYDNEDNLVKADAQILENITSESGYVTVNVDVAENQYVRYFILDNLDNLSPLTQTKKAITIK